MIWIEVAVGSLVMAIFLILTMPALVHKRWPNNVLDDIHLKNIRAWRDIRTSVRIILEIIHEKIPEIYNGAAYIWLIVERIMNTLLLL